MSAPPTEHVLVSVDGAAAGSQDVDTADGPDAFDIAVDVPAGTHEVRVDWEDHGQVVATKSVTVTHTAAPRPDGDDDTVADDVDNCPAQANADQADLDHDGVGDVCDPDTDGDGYTNTYEIKRRTDPANANSHPKGPKR